MFISPLRKVFRFDLTLLLRYFEIVLLNNFSLNLTLVLLNALQPCSRYFVLTAFLINLELFTGQWLLREPFLHIRSVFSIYLRTQEHCRVWGGLNIHKRVVWLGGTPKAGCWSLFGVSVRTFEFLDLPTQFRQEGDLILHLGLRGLSSREDKLLTVHISHRHTGSETVVELGEVGEPLPLRVDVLEQYTDLDIVKDVKLLHLGGEVLMRDVT